MVFPIKKAHKKTRYTQKEIESLRQCADPDTGPKYFLDNYFKYCIVKGQLLLVLLTARKISRKLSST